MKFWRDISHKLSGTPSMVLGIILLGGLAYVAHGRLSDMEQEKTDILSQLETAENTNFSLLKIIEERERIIAQKEGTISEFEGQVRSLSGTVGTLQKLSNTDEELLKKYSKVYFLNENYYPPKLVQVDKEYLTNSATNFQIHAQVAPFLEDMIKAAAKDDMNLRIASGFRSFQTQSALKSAYKVTYGSGANAFSADQGYSEHQLGTALDFSTVKLGANFNPFASEPEYQWLLKNAYKYGFILSYPQNNTYYKFEPWHWRFVGTDLAKYLHNEGKNFYDLDQREIDKYLVTIFD